MLLFLLQTVIFIYSALQLQVCLINSVDRVPSLNETIPKTVTFEDDQQTTPKIVDTANTSHDLRLMADGYGRTVPTADPSYLGLSRNDRPVRNNRAPTTTTATTAIATETATTEGPARPRPRSLPSPPRTLLSDDPTEHDYSQLDFHSTGNGTSPNEDDNSTDDRKRQSHNDGSIRIILLQCVSKNCASVNL